MLGGKCPYCDTGELIWQSDFSFEDYGVEGCGIVQVTSCTDCEVYIESYIKERIESI